MCRHTCKACAVAAPVSLPSGVSCPEFAGLENLRDRATPEWCNTDTARRNSATECHKYFVYSTGTGMYQKCKHDAAAGACKMAGDTCTASSAIGGSNNKGFGKTLRRTRLNGTEY